MSETYYPRHAARSFNWNAPISDPRSRAEIDADKRRASDFSGGLKSGTVKFQPEKLIKPCGVGCDLCRAFNRDVAARNRARGLGN